MEYEVLGPTDELKKCYRNFCEENDTLKMDLFLDYLKKTYKLTFKSKKGKFYVSGDEKNLMMFIMKWS